MDKEYLENLVGAEAAEQILQRHDQALRKLRCEHALSLAVRDAGGRNETAIRALINESDIAGAQDMAAAAASAVEGLKRQHSYLFQLPVVSSPGTGSAVAHGAYSMEDVGKMSMAEYRKYRGR